MKKEKDIKEILLADFYEVDAGWVCFKLTVGQQVFHGRFSEVWDPILDFKHWLEAISIGVEQTSFSFDPEGNDVKFDFERVSYDREVLTITEPYEQAKIFIKANIDRKQILKAFYVGLLSFANSDKFKSEEWEVEYMKERLCKALELDEETIIHSLSELNKKELGELLFNADPQYIISIPTAKDKNEEWNMLLHNAVEGTEIPKEHTKQEKAMEWNIPNDYDYWTSQNKRNFVIECLNEATSGYRGIKLSEFRSPIIEKFLNDDL